MKGQLLWLLVLVVVNFFSALGVVYTTHESRKEFVELQSLYRERDEMNIEWGQLQLEQSTWATHSRIEQVARSDLGMVLPDPEKIVVVKP